LILAASALVAALAALALAASNPIGHRPGPACALVLRPSGPPSAGSRSGWKKARGSPPRLATAKVLDAG
jgi:hypothetical protein